MRNYDRVKVRRIGVITQLLWKMKMGDPTHRGKNTGAGTGKPTAFHQTSLFSILFLRAKTLASTRDDTPSLLKMLLR